MKFPYIFPTDHKGTFVTHSGEKIGEWAVSSKDPYFWGVPLGQLRSSLPRDEESKKIFLKNFPFMGIKSEL